MEDKGEGETDFTVIETASDTLDSSIKFHLVTDILGFVLFMHQQIPSKREVRMGIRRLDKLMNTISSLRTALQLMITEFPAIERVILILGSSPLRPLNVYELNFSCETAASGGEFTRNRVVETLSKKAIRVLVSKGAGSSSSVGPTKLFLFVEAPSSVNLHLHFLPKRDFRYSKKIVPFKVRFSCRTKNLEREVCADDTHPTKAITSHSSNVDDVIWFQCRHIIKGLASRASPTEE
uniref:HORMA domain-containing protein n=1 Tax=Solanum lycopersicum TaxID=4081 RepID=A0A3Q7I5R1_SOLLC